MNARSVLVASLLFALAACGSGAPATPPASGGAPAPAAKSKPLTVKGSDTMVILSQRWAERFMAGHAGATVQVTGGGSGTGIAALTNGTTEIAASSRPMKAEEKAKVQEKRGAAATEYAVALDGLAVFAHSSNTISELSIEQLRRIYRGEVKRWSEVGGPDQPIVLYGRENNSGTYAYFKEHVLQEKDFAPETQTLPGTAAVVNAVSRDVNAIGYGGIAYDKGIKALKVRKDEASPALEPTMDNVVSGAYPISRKLFLYTAGPASGTGKEFLDFALSDEGQKVISEVGYYPLPKAGAAPAPAAPAPADPAAPAPAAPAPTAPTGG